MGKRDISSEHARDKAAKNRGGGIRDEGYENEQMPMEEMVV